MHTCTVYGVAQKKSKHCSLRILGTLLYPTWLDRQAILGDSWGGDGTSIDCTMQTRKYTALQVCCLRERLESFRVASGRKQEPSNFTSTSNISIFFVLVR